MKDRKKLNEVLSGLERLPGDTIESMVERIDREYNEKKKQEYEDRKQAFLARRREMTFEERLEQVELRLLFDGIPQSKCSHDMIFR